MNFFLNTLYLKYKRWRNIKKEEEKIQSFSWTMLKLIEEFLNTYTYSFLCVRIQMLNGN